jgi:tetratricopeptide (TPR) repeat protein
VPLSEAGLVRDLARTEGLAGAVLRELGRGDEAWERLSRAYEAVTESGDDVAIAELAARLSAASFGRGERRLALELADRALTIADGERLGEVLVMAMIGKAIALVELGRPAESNALLTHALKLAVEQDLGHLAARASYNLADNQMAEGRFEEAQGTLKQGLELIRRRGDRQMERTLLAQEVIAMVALGHWDVAVEQTASLLDATYDIYAAQTVCHLPMVFAARGDAGGLRSLLDAIGPSTGWAVVDDGIRLAHAVLMREEGHASDGLEQATAAVHAVIEISDSGVPTFFAEGVACAFAAGRPDVVAELLERVDALKPAQLLPLLDAEASRARARLAAHRGEQGAAEQWFRRAIDLFRELATPFPLARAQLEYAELLARTGRPPADVAKPRDEAAGVFAELRAEPWLARADALASGVPA